MSIGPFDPRYAKSVLLAYLGLVCISSTEASSKKRCTTQYTFVMNMEVNLCIAITPSMWEAYTFLNRLVRITEIIATSAA